MIVMNIDSGDKNGGVEEPEIDESAISILGGVEFRHSDRWVNARFVGK